MPPLSKHPSKKKRSMIAIKLCVNISFYGSFEIGLPKMMPKYLEFEHGI